MAKSVEDLCTSLCFSNGSEIEFKRGIQRLVQDYGYLGKACFRDIGMTLRKWTVEYGGDNVERIWRLADEADPRIRRAWEEYQTKFLGGR